MLAHRIEEMEQGRSSATPACRSSTSTAPVADAATTSASPSACASSRAAPDFRRQTLARCVLPARGGPTTERRDWARCGQQVDDVGRGLVGAADQEIAPRPARAGAAGRR